MALVYFYTPGTCSVAGMVALEWVGRPYQLCRVDGKARQSDNFKRINPQAKVPAMVVDGHFLAENAAVLPRIARGRHDLVPADDTDLRDEFNQWMSVLGTSFHVAFYPYYMSARYIADPALQPQVKEAALVQIRKQYGIMEAHLSDRPWLLGEQKTVLDPYLYSMARWGRSFLDLPTEFPVVSRHLLALEQDPGVQVALALESGKATSTDNGAYQGQVALDQL